MCSLNNNNVDIWPNKKLFFPLYSIIVIFIYNVNCLYLLFCTYIVKSRLAFIILYTNYQYKDCSSVYITLEKPKLTTVNTYRLRGQLLLVKGDTCFKLLL